MRYMHVHVIHLNVYLSLSLLYKVNFAIQLEGLLVTMHVNIYTWPGLK